MNLLNQKFYIPIQISLKGVHAGSIDNKPALVQIMAWHHFGAKPLAVPIIAKLFDTKWHHQATMS